MRKKEFTKTHRSARRLCVQPLRQEHSQLKCPVCLKAPHLSTATTSTATGPCTRRSTWLPMMPIRGLVRPSQFRLHRPLRRIPLTPRREVLSIKHLRPKRTPHPNQKRPHPASLPCSRPKEPTKCRRLARLSRGSWTLPPPRSSRASPTDDLDAFFAPPECVRSQLYTLALELLQLPQVALHSGPTR